MTARNPKVIHADKENLVPFCVVEKDKSTRNSFSGGKNENFKILLKF